MGFYRKGLSFVAIAFFLPLVSWAKPLVIISDIDDTLKQSNIRALIPVSALGSREFHGMSSLYRSWLDFKKRQTSVSETRGPRLIYVTGSPGKLQELGRWFLDTNDYPHGAFVGRQSFFDDTKEFKVKAIMAIVERFEDADFVLIGDNGEHDPEVYHEVVQRQGQIPGRRNFSVFIHQVYDGVEGGAPLYPNQVPWLTSADLAVQFLSQNWVSPDLAESLLHRVTQLLASGDEDDRESVLSDWVTCNEFLYAYARPVDGIDERTEVLLEGYEDAIVRRCFRDNS